MRKIILVFSFALIFLLLVGCEKVTEAVDGVDGSKTPEVAPDPAKPIEEKPVEKEDALTGGAITEPEEPKSTTHTVRMTADGFNPDKLYIKAGDTVVWKNTRYGTIDKAMIIGVRECRDVRSGFLKSGESFTWTFDTPMTCTIADGVMTTKESKVYVE